MDIIVNHIIGRFFQVLICLLIIAFVWCVVAATINTLFPTKVILFGLTKNQRQEVKKAWKDMSERYKLLKKMQSGIYSRLPIKRKIGDYGFTIGAIAWGLIFWRCIFVSDSYLFMKSIGSSKPSIPQTYYEYTVHELTHTLAKIFMSSFKEGPFRTTIKWNDNTYEENIRAFIDSTKEKYGITDDDIARYVTHYGVAPSETLSECMWIYLRLEEDKELREKHQKDYEVVKKFITEFDQIYKTKTL